MGQRDGRASFFLINQAVDPGLIKVLENEIVPKLEALIPNQPTSEQLDEQPHLHRFTIVFDREGYSPALFKRMKKRRIACITYHKHPKNNWPEEEFHTCEVKLVSGEATTMKLAERGTYLESGKIWVREIRKLTESGKQTSVLSTDYTSDLRPISGAMFARWSQENFFKYMREHYGLDRLVNYSVEELPDTTKVINPDYRRLDSEVRKHRSVLNRKLAEFGGLTMDSEIEPMAVEEYERKKAKLRDEIEQMANIIAKLKEKRKQTPRHITAAKLPKEERFKRLSTESKHLIDTIKMIAYRAETANVHILREKMSKRDEARSLVRSIYDTEADIIPNEKEEILTVRLHHQANRSADAAVAHLCSELNETETIFPGTNLRLRYELVSS